MKNKRRYRNQPVAPFCLVGNLFHSPSAKFLRRTVLAFAPCKVSLNRAAKNRTRIAGNSTFVYLSRINPRKGPSLEHPQHLVVESVWQWLGRTFIPLWNHAPAR